MHILSYWSEFLATDSEVPGSIHGHYKKKSSGSGTGSTEPRETTEELLERNISGSGLETENTAVGIRHTDHVATSIRKKVGTNFADKRRSIGRYSSLVD
jgi:hypothetical protein